MAQPCGGTRVEVRRQSRIVRELVASSYCSSITSDEISKAFDSKTCYKHPSVRSNKTEAATFNLH